MVTFEEFVDETIRPTLGVFHDEYDMEAIAHLVGVWDEREGWRFAEGCDPEHDTLNYRRAATACRIRHDQRDADLTSRAWRMPPLDTAYPCDGGRVCTLGDMLEDCPPELVPSNEEEFDLLMFAFGCACA